MPELKRLALRLRDGLLAFLSGEEDPEEPRFDPVQLGAVCIACLTVIGALYWLLWTLLVYEGGLQTKLRAGLAVLFTSRTLKDFGYEGAPYAMGAFAGWAGNLCALGFCLLALWALLHLYRTAKTGAAPKTDA
ncbi:MAG: hypothetical protein PHU21_00435 [Elusimicrobia bacterium]|jgi:preprotein translocase subunit Sec61beta|nr:hypothetical protein [Elusimicrobiota bacterium]